MGQLDIRLRAPSSRLVGLPWLQPLAEWDVTEVPLRDVPVGPSRHLVKFVEADAHLWALKELPARAALKEYEVLRQLEAAELPAVRAAGVVLQPFDDTAILVTRYLDRSWQYRRLLMRLPTGARDHRERLLDAVASLLVDLHRNGVFWGDCSLANLLFTRDGQRLQAWMVDAETSEVHHSLSDGQRRHDLELMQENLVGGLIDVAIRAAEVAAGDTDPDYDVDADLPRFTDAADALVQRYQALWEVVHREPTFLFHDRFSVESRIRALNDLGFAVDEVRIEQVGATQELLRLKVAVAGRRFHSSELQRLTGLVVGEGQAQVLLNDLRAYRSRLRVPDTVPERTTARRWVEDVMRAGMARAHEAVQGIGDPVQAYCDLLEVRWLLSERAGHDVGDAPALEALSRRGTPAGSSAEALVAEVPDEQLPALPSAVPAPLEDA